MPSLKNKQLWDNHTLWSPSYFVSSVGDAPLAVLKCYIGN
ncbi:transposase [Microcystis aeruginosa]